MARLSLFVPTLAHALQLQASSAHWREQFPALYLLLSRARRSSRFELSLEQRLLQCCGVNEDERKNLSLAQLSASIDCEDMLEFDLWRADPVHLRTEPHRLVLFNDAEFAPDARSADALIEALNDGVFEHEFFRGANPARWYLRVDHPIEATTSSIGEVAGRSIMPHLPRGPDGASLNQLMTEAQLRLHHSPVNEAREAGAIPPINSVWIWGGGASSMAGASALDCVVGNDLLSAALAKRTNKEFRENASVDQCMELIRARDNHVMVVIGSPSGGIVNAPAEIDLAALERDWCAPTLSNLRRFRLDECMIITDRFDHRVRPLDVYNIWRRYDDSAQDII